MEAIDRLKQTAAQAATKSEEARNAKKAQKHKTGNWRIYWEDTLREYYPEALVSYTTTDAANLKRAVNRGVPQEDVADMIAWAVKNWERVRRVTSFGDKPRGPAVPDMKFLIVVVNQVHAAFNADRQSATLDLSKRRESLRPAPAPEAASITVKPLPRPSLPRTAAPLRPVPARPRLTDHNRAEAERQRLGLKQWGNGK